MTSRARRHAEIAHVQASIRRLEAGLESMEQTFRTRGGCCAACLFGQRYHETEDKVDRVKAWLAILLDRELHANAATPAKAGPGRAS